MMGAAAPAVTTDAGVDSVRVEDECAGGKYRTIVADPPWEIGAFPEWGDGKGTIATPYGTMGLEAIKRLPVGNLAAPEAHLYLWTTTQFLLPAYEVAEAWGFEVMYPMVWCKPPRGIGLGGKFSSNVEFILFCREREGALAVTSMLREAARMAGMSVRDVNQAMGTSDMAGWWLSELPHRSRIPTVEQWAKLKKVLGLGESEWDEVVETVNDSRNDPNKCDTRWWQWPRGPHSAKPEAFLDLVEQMSPAPRLEMFARRDRLGWDTWGNESLGTAELAA
jgi:N6-adenosine-specific RNA methylase IME4